MSAAMEASEEPGDADSGLASVEEVEGAAAVGVGSEVEVLEVAAAETEVSMGTARGSVCRVEGT
jgi:hypothetical protein